MPNFLSLEIGTIVEGISNSEPVIISRVQKLGSRISISYTGVNSNISNNKVFAESEIENLRILTKEGEFNFQGDPKRFCLFAEAERINSAYQFDPLFAVNCSIVDPLPHQVEAVYKYLLPQTKIRFLLADDTGAGKTIMTGLLIKELQTRGLVERILVVTPGGLTKQWQEDELAIKFNLNFKLVNRSVLISDPTVFHTSNNIVTSIDFISREEVINSASGAYWDLIVFDEAHKLSAYDYGTRVYKSKRYEAAYTLAQQCEHLLLLTATPHRGRMDTFKKLLQLIDEDIFATEELANSRVKDIEKDGANKFFIRRLKEDMKDWDNNPLYKQRFTQTTAYELTPEEKQLYDDVTSYLTVKKEEAKESRNIHVSLALTVMQRRLVSSIFAIRNTLFRRYTALQGIIDETNKNPNLWSQRQKLEEYDIDNLDDFDELDDDEREGLESILSDPKKFKLFTTAKDIKEIQQETREVKRLYDLANSLYTQNQEEQKLKELKKLLETQNVINGEKLVIFTEHKDTLMYLEERLRNTGYKVATIHGGKTVDERREAQWDFAKPDTQILIATDAAGEGINLQFCRLLINWDIPWNPNRLEQRMGRIHRYGQKQDVLVFNMVASNTKEGQVLEKLLKKLDVIRESIGDDRVYDVIQDVLENVSLDQIFDSVLNGKTTALNVLLDESDEQLEATFKKKIQDQKDELSHSKIDYKDARILKDNSDEKRLQPIYIKLFFERAFKLLGGSSKEIRTSIFQVTNIPIEVSDTLKAHYNYHTDIRQLYFCFDKKIFWDYQSINDIGKVHYINPGNPLFDSVVYVVRDKFRADMLKGTILISPEDKNDYFAYFVKTQIVDNRKSKNIDSIAGEKITMVYNNASGDFEETSPSKFIDLHPPTEFTKPIDIPSPMQSDEVVEWTFLNITEKQFKDTQDNVLADSERRKEYLETAFRELIMTIQLEINELQGKLIYGDPKIQDKIGKKQDRLDELKLKKELRLKELELRTQLSPKSPEVLGCAYVVPLSQVEYVQHYGMSRDDEAELIAMKHAIDHEINDGWSPFDVSKDNEGYDIKSVSPDDLKRYIEVKGRSADGGVMLSENEMNRLSQLGDSAWLYIVINCKSKPELFRIQNPGKNLRFEQKTKGIQYFLPMSEWKAKIC